MVYKIAIFALLVCLGILLLNSGFNAQVATTSGLSLEFIKFLRIVGGSAALIAAAALALE